MRVADQLRGLHRTLLGNRARVALTLLGMMIGSATLVLLASLLRGGREALLRTSQAASESDLIDVEADEPPTAELLKTRRELSERDAELLSSSPLLAGTRAASKGWKDSRAYFRGRGKNVSVDADTPAALSLYRLGLVRGRFIDEGDMTARRRVCVVGYEVWRELLDSADDLSDMRLTVAGEEWAVVGALQDKPMLGNTTDTWIWNRRVVVPQTTFDAVYNPSHEAVHVFVRLMGSESLAERLDALKLVVRSTILRSHLGVHNFKLRNDDKERQQTNLILGIVQVLLLGTGLLAILVGGINIMNIMLVTVTERTREIGIRRAIGATPGEILTQFLLEAAVLGLAGGVIGVLGGIGCAALSTLALRATLGAWTLHIEPWSIALGVGLALCTGVAFGLFPAWQAAKLDPVEALRFE